MAATAAAVTDMAVRAAMVRAVMRGAMMVEVARVRALMVRAEVVMVGVVTEEVVMVGAAERVVARAGVMVAQEGPVVRGGPPEEKGAALARLTMPSCPSKRTCEGDTQFHRYYISRGHGRGW